MKEITLTNSDNVAIIDEGDYGLVSGVAWWAIASQTTQYAISKSGSMHRMILGLSSGDGVVVDHINGNGLDNRRSNLRRTTHKNNVRNRRPRRDGSSQYKGVHRMLLKSGYSWRASIGVDGKRIALGVYSDETDAALAYDAAARANFGEFARCNLPKPPETEEPAKANRRAMPPDLRVAIKAAWDAGLTTSEIMSKFKVANSTVGSICYPAPKIPHS